MAKYCIGCGNRCADNDSRCSRCGMVLNTQRVQHNDYKSMTGEIRNQQIGDLDTDKVDASGRIPIQRKNNSKKIMMIVVVVLVVFNEFVTLLLFVVLSVYPPVNDLTFITKFIVLLAS